MKQLILILAGWLAATSVAWSATGTLEFDRQKLQFDSAAGRIEYTGLEAAGVGQALTLPARSYYLAIHQTDTTSSLSFQVSRWEDLGHLETSLLTSDTPTGEIRGVSDPSDMLTYPGLGRNAVEVTGVWETDQGRYLGLLLFPVTVQEDGGTRLNSSVALELNGQPVNVSQLMGDLPCPASLGQRYAPDMSPGDDPPVEYLIVAAREFAEPLQRLAAYKNSTGYVTSVRYIDDILAGQSGRDDAEKLRNYLLRFYLDGGRFVLMAGDNRVLPIRYAYHLAVDSLPDPGLLQVCDLYFADLTGEWDLDNDNVWGEPSDDRPDLIPELSVGRLPFHMVEQFDAYVDKLITYETEPGGDDPGYLSRAFFFSSDQMRDYSGGGQHARIAQAYPASFTIDTVNGVELERGDDPSPHNVPPCDLEAVLSDGYGVVNIVAHGNGMLFEVRTSEYNKSPKSRFTTDTTPSDNGVISHLASNKKVSLYYSLACDNGAFDCDYPPEMPNLVVATLGLPEAGAVAFVANSRWGWVGSSHLLQKAFFDSLFAHPGRPAVAAMYDSKLRYYYVRDVVYGQNFYGDPTLVVYDGEPDNLSLAVDNGSDGWEIAVTSGGSPVSGCLVVLSDSTGLLGRTQTDSQGHAAIAHSYDPLNSYTVAAVKPGYVTAREYVSPSIAADNDELIDHSLPAGFGLSQNYPNPFNPQTTIRFELPRRSQIDLSVYNILGQQVVTLSQGIRAVGVYEAVWDGCDQYGASVASGIYFYRLSAEGFVSQKKMLLLR